MTIRIESLIAVLVAALAASAAAQDPFGTPTPMPGAAKPGATAPADDPFGGGGIKEREKPKPEDAAGVLNQEPLVIQQLRDSNPATPKDLVIAAHATLQYGRPDETKRYLAQLLTSMPAEDDLAALPGQVGSDVLIRLSRDPRVQPEGKQVADAAFAAVQKQLHDPGRINAYLGQLSGPDRGARAYALSKLVESGPYIVSPMLQILADPVREKEHPYIQAALIRLSKFTEGPLLGALDVPDNALRAQVIMVLSRIGSSKATPHLVRLAVDDSLPAAVHEAARAGLTQSVGKVPDRYEAERYLTREIKSLLSGRVPYLPDENDQIEMWIWDPMTSTVIDRKLAIADAAALLASRLSADLYELRTGSNEALRLKLLTSLEIAQVLAGLDQPLPMEAGTSGTAAAQAGPQVVSQVLADALRHNRIPAAIAAIHVLGQIGNASLLSESAPAESPLALAMRHPDRRVRVLAALTTLDLNPRESFAGASRVLETLGSAISTSSDDRVLVAHPRGEDAQSLIGYLAALGYAGDAAYSGRLLTEQAFAGPDYQFILISDAIDGPPVTELVQWLRRDYRTAGTPIGVMARSDDVFSLRYAFDNDPLTIVFPRVYSPETMVKEVEKLLAIAGRNLISRDERIEHARMALAALEKLARSPVGYTLFDLRRHEPAVISALNNLALTAGAARVLATIGSPKCQSALVDFASRNTLPLADRQAASAAFASAVQSRGLNLTQQQIATQYERYNVSEKLDPDTQAVLALLLDAIEAPAIARGELSQK